MGKIYRFFFFFLIIVQSQWVYAQNVTVSGANVSSNGSYATLQAAFTAINNFSQTGNNISVLILGNTTETGTATLNQNAGTWSALNISVSGSRLIQGNIATQLIDLNGADNVSIDGLNSGGNSLIIDNTNSSASGGTIRFVNDAKNNIISNCTIKGSSTATNSGIIFFSSYDATLLQGNDNNTINNCIIRESSGYPLFGIFSYQAIGGTSSRYNSGINITNNQIINCVSTSAATTRAAAIHCFTQGSTDWVIMGNSIYYTSGIATTGSTENYGIRISGSNAQNMNISNNYIGGTAINCGGSALSFLNTINGNKFCAININSSNSGIASSIQGNTISNITVNTNSSQSTSPYIFSGISVEGGLVNIGTITGNRIGSNTINGNITVNAATSVGGYVVGIASSGASTNSTISNDTISGITVTNPASSATYVHLRAIYIVSQSASISNNVIGGTLTNSLLNSSGNTSATSCMLAGITSLSTSGVSITGNQIANLTYSALGSLFQVVGIYTSTGNNTISTNIINGLTAANPNIQSGATASVIGILDNNTTTTGETISQNTIYNISNTYTASSLAVNSHGMNLTFSGSGHTIRRNLVYDIKLSNSSTSAELCGIKLLGGNPTISNNMLTIGNGLTNNPFINAINLQGGAPKIYFNTVVLTGAAAGASSAFTNVIRIQGVSSGSEFIDNIFYNNRTSNSATSNQCMFFTTVAQRDNVTTCNYNNLFNNVANTVLVSVTVGSPYANLAAWQANSGGRDANSLSQTLNFVAIANDLHLTDCTMAGKGTDITGITIDYDNSTRNSPPWIGADEPFKTWSGGVGTWNTPTSWTPSGVPASYNDVLINSGTVTLDVNAICHSIKIASLAILTASTFKITLDASACIASFFSNSGTFNANTGTVQFDGASSILSGSIAGSTATIFNKVILNTGVTFPLSSSPTIGDTLRLNSGSYLNTSAPNYAMGSVLLYYTGNASPPYDRGLEWSAGSGKGYPYNVRISNNTTLRPAKDDETYNSVTFSLANDLTIDAGSSLYMDFNDDDMLIPLIIGNDIFISGNLSLSEIAPGDIKVGGDWTRAASGNFYPNNRAVYFNGAADQVVSRTGNGTETFNYMIIDKANAGTYVKPDNTAGSLTDITINATSGDVLQLNNNGSLNLNGRTITLEGNSSGGAAGSIYVNGARTITNSQGINNGKFEIKSTSNPNQITWFTKTVSNNAGTGTLTFDQNVLVTIADGKMDFGYSGGTNLTTIQGILQINLGASVVYNSCYYSVSPPSTLRFANTVDYQVNTTDLTWAPGSIYSGLPGIPYNVEINNNGTDLTINSTRAVRNNLTITDGTLTLAAATGNFYVGGNWSRSGATSAFTDNNNYVEFGGSADQTVSCITPSSTKETFYGLTINNTDPSPLVTLTGTTSIEIKDQLNLLSGILTCGSGEVYVSNSAASAITGHKINPAVTGYLNGSWINGKLRRKINSGGTTGTYDFPLGTASNYELTSLNMNNLSGVSDVLGFFTTDNSACSKPNSQVVPVYVLGTLINTLLNAGFWTLTPDVAPASGDYDITLRESGYSNPAVYDSMYAVIKRDNCIDEWYDQGTHDDVTQSTINSVVTAVRTDLNSFSDYAIGLGEFILPIELSAFTVSLSNGNGVLEWNTAAEYNSHLFEIERSLNGVGFETVGLVDAAGFSTIPKKYFYTDHDVSELGSTKIFYRLRMVDLDNTFSYSAVKWIDLEETADSSAITIFPNPVNDLLAVSLDVSSDQEALLQIIDVAGRVNSETAVVLKKGLNFIEADAGGLVAGLYMVRIVSGRNFYTARMVKQ